MDDVHYTEGVCGDGAAILFDGKPLTISEILNKLNTIERLKLERDEAWAELEKWKPVHTNDGMCHAHIRAPIEEDWHNVLAAIVAASHGMQDFEDTQHTVIVYEVRYTVDLDAENGNPPNVYEVRAALGGEG